MLKGFYQKPRLLFGCGNPLFGDDGFGAEVIQYLEAFYPLPREVELLDAGTAVRDFLMDVLLMEQKPSQIIIVDAMSITGAAAGEIREIGVKDIQPAKICDFSLHQFPTVNMLKEIICYTSIDVRVLVVQPDHIPDCVKPGLSPAIKAAIEPMCQRIMALLNQPTAMSNRHSSEKVYIQVGQLAQKLGVHRNTVTNWIKSGKIAARPTAGKKYIVREAELRRFCRQSGLDEGVLKKLI